MGQVLGELFIFPRAFWGGPEPGSGGAESGTRNEQKVVSGSWAGRVANMNVLAVVWWGGELWTCWFGWAGHLALTGIFSPS